MFREELKKRLESNQDHDGYTFWNKCMSLNKNIQLSHAF